MNCLTYMREISVWMEALNRPPARTCALIATQMLCPQPLTKFWSLLIASRCRIILRIRTALWTPSFLMVPMISTVYMHACTSCTHTHSFLVASRISTACLCFLLASGNTHTPSHTQTNAARCYHLNAKPRTHLESTLVTLNSISLFLSCVTHD